MPLVLSVVLQSPPNTLEQSGRHIDVESQGPRDTRALAWSRTYCGNYHEIMLNNINAMKRRSVYADSVALVQSSGTGKSRMVNEQANLVFTIPFNVLLEYRRACSRGKPSLISLECAAHGDT